MRRYHDLGGLPGGSIDKSQHEFAYWEKQVDALLVLLADRCQLIRVDELRRGIETLGEEAYNTLSYYERWIASITNILVEKGVLSREEIDARIQSIRERLEVES